MKKDSIKVSTKEGKVLLEGELFAPVKCNETIWNLIPGLFSFFHVVITKELNVISKRFELSIRLITSYN